MKDTDRQMEGEIHRHTQKDGLYGRYVAARTHKHTDRREEGQTSRRKNKQRDGRKTIYTATDR